MFQYKVCTNVPELHNFTLLLKKLNYNIIILHIFFPLSACFLIIFLALLRKQYRAILVIRGRKKKCVSVHLLLRVRAKSPHATPLIKTCVQPLLHPS